MAEQMIIEVSEQAARRAKWIAAHSRQRVEDVLAEWIDRMANEQPVEWLSDSQVLALADTQMEAAQQKELGNLLAASREGTLDAQGQDRLESLMQTYRRGMIRKAQAIHEAVRRGLRPPVN